MSPDMINDNERLCFPRITNDDREEEMEENMQLVNTMIGRVGTKHKTFISTKFYTIGNLRNMAVDMGSELGNQNQLLEDTITRATTTGIRVKSANERAGKLL